jgi:hypothetical protein
MKMIVLVAIVYLGLGADVVLSQVPFYQDKTISVVLGGPPAGSADMRTKAVTAILRKHIPGNPTIIVQYNPSGTRFTSLADSSRITLVSRNEDLLPDTLVRRSISL